MTPEKPPLPPEERLQVAPWRATLSNRVVAVVEPAMRGVASHWLFGLNAAALLLLAGSAAAPLLLALGLAAPAFWLYEIYSPLCHQWAFRSFFLFGASPVYSLEHLHAHAVDPYTFVGDPVLGWKMAFCERDVAIFGGLLLFGLLYAARWRTYAMRYLTYAGLALLSLPIAIDGFTQLLGVRESTWELRVATGLLFGTASAWFLYPRFDRSLRRNPRA